MIKFVYIKSKSRKKFDSCGFTFNIIKLHLHIMSFDGSTFTRKIKYAMGFGVQLGMDFEHCLTFKNNKMYDNSAAAFGCCDPTQIVTSVPYKLVGNKILVQNDKEEWTEGFVLENENSLKSLGENGIVVEGVVFTKQTIE